MRRLVLLAVLAAHGERETSRDTLVALLWPDSDEGRARQALSQALYSLRHDLGEQRLFLGQRGLRLNPAVLTSDVDEFRRAVAASDDEGAVRSYGGDFLDGVHVSQSQEFEQWTDSQRQLLRGQYVVALERLWVAATAAGDRETSLSLATRLAATDPLSHRAALRRAEAQVAVGDRAAALKYIRQHEDHVRRELEVELDDALRDLKISLEARSHESANGRRSTESVDVQSPIEVRGAATVQPASVSLAASTSAASNEDGIAIPNREGRAVLARGLTSERATARSVWRWRGVAVAIVALIAVAVRSRSVRPVGAEPRATPRTLIVTPFEFAGTPTEAFKAHAVERLLAASLASIPHLRVGDRNGDSASGFPLADTLAGSIVSVATTGSLSAALVLSSQHGTPFYLRAKSERGDLTALADDLARQLILRLADPAGSEQILAAASGSARSLDALQAFVDGEALFAAGRWKAAGDAFATAVRRDSTFALAQYRLSEAANWSGEADLQGRAAASAFAQRGGLPLRERLLIEAYYAWNVGDAAGAERGYRDVTTRYPHDVEAWYQLGEVAFHSGPVYGRPMDGGKPAYERVVALASGAKVARRTEARLHLARIASAQGDLVAFDSLYAVLTPVSSGSDLLELNTLAACARGRPADLAAMARDMQSASGLTYAVNAQRCAVYGGSLARAVTLYAGLRRSIVEPTYRVMGLVEEASLRLAMGQRRAALATVERAESGALAPALLLVRAMLAYADDSLPLAARVALIDSLTGPATWPIPSGIDPADAVYGFLHPRFAPYVAGLLAVQTGDSIRASAQVQRLLTLGGDSAERVAGRNFAHSLQAHLAARDGNAEIGLAHLDSLRGVPTTRRIEYALYRVPERLLRARLLFALRRFDEAVDVARTVGQRSPFEYAFVPAATRVARDALVAAGHPDSARALVERQRRRGIRVE